MGNMTPKERPVPASRRFITAGLKPGREYIEHPQRNVGQMRRPVYVGERFGRWTAVAFGEARKSRLYYLVRCDCGTERMVQSTNLFGGISRSCGCLIKDIIAEQKRKPNFYSAITTVILGYKRNAKERGLDWGLTREQAEHLFKQPCYYCDAIGGNYRPSSYGSPFRYNGIDRVDNSLGYYPENVVPCCGVCNRCKNTLSKEEFIAWAKRVAGSAERARA